jgi:hypothetical protein
VLAIISLATACASPELGGNVDDIALGQQAVTANAEISVRPDSEGLVSARRLEPQARISKQAVQPQVPTRLTGRFQRDGSAEIVDAVELPGYLKLERGLRQGNIYEVRTNGESLTLQAPDLDFERRALSPERDVTTETESVEAFVDIPGIGLEEAKDAEVMLHRISAPHDEKYATIAALERLCRGARVKLALSVASTKVRQFLNQHGRRVQEL